MNRSRTINQVLGWYFILEGISILDIQMASWSFFRINDPIFWSIAAIPKWISMRLDLLH